MIRTSRLLSIGLFMFIFCFGNLWAQENRLWDKNGDWLNSEEKILRHEIRFNAAYSRFVQKYWDYDYYFAYDSSTWKKEFKNITDNYSIVSGYRYYLNQRYYNKNVPFAFIPFNYRNSYIDVSGSYDWERTNQFSYAYYKYHGGYAAVDYLNHLGIAFLGASFKYLENSRTDRFDKTETFDFGASTGYYNSHGKYGFGLDYISIWNGSKYGNSLEKRISARISGEEMINPYLIVRAEANYLYDIDQSEKYLFELPISGSLLIPYTWLEFEAGFYYSKNKQILIFVDKTYGWFVNTRKYFNNMAVAVGLDYSVYTYESWDNTWDFTLNGECDYNINTDFIFKLDLSYGFGRDFLMDAKDSMFGVNVNIVAYL